MSNDRDEEKKHKLEVVSNATDAYKFPPEVDMSWDMSYSVDADFPEVPPTPWYESEYTMILRVPAERGELFARLFFTRQCNTHNYVPVGDAFSTARFWCLKVRV